MIPNIVHFVWITGPNSREFSFVNHLAVRAAHDVQQPDKLLIHCNQEPVGNPNWERIRPYAEIVPLEAPDAQYPQYQSDIARLNILLEHGGIYLDTDMLLLKPLLVNVDHECVVSADSPAQTALNAGLLMAKPGAKFIREWARTLTISPEWAHHAVVQPWKILQEHPTWAHIRPSSEFIPFDWHDKTILGVAGSVYDDAYAVHVWETIWADDLARIDDGYLRSANSIFAYLFKKYARRLKIAVYAISKNESLFVERFCTAAKDADLIFIADTGSTDDTVALAHQHGTTTADILISPWRFDHARNAALALLPSDIDVCVSLDLDEVLQPGWREEIERVWTPGTTRLRYMFDWGTGIAFPYEKIHARTGYRWTNPCHEYPVPDRINEQYANTDMLLVIHKPDNTKSRGQYLDLLRVSVEENPTDPRNAFYYARELSFSGQHEKSIAECQRYLALPKADWANERCYAMRVISRCYGEMGQLDKALSWAYRAAAEAPDTREPWTEAASIAHTLGRWAQALAQP